MQSKLTLFRALFCIIVISMVVLCDANAATPIKNLPPLVIEGVTVIDVVNARRIGPRSVLIEDGRISAIGKTVDIPAGAVRVDGRGKFLVPGLIDMHVHLFNNASHRPANEWAFPLFVANGVTGVREMLSLPEQGPQIERWNDAVQNGNLIAPRILAAGIRVNGDSEHVLRQQVRNAKQAGADFIKVFSEVPAAKWRVIIDEANMQQIAVDGHVPAQLAWLDAASAGQRTVEHLMQSYEACSSIEARVLASRRHLDGDAATSLRDEQEREVLNHFDPATCRRAAKAVAATHQYQTPTMVLSYFESRPSADFGLDSRWPLLRADEQARWRRNLTARTPDDASLATLRWQTSCRIVRILNAAGLPILAGTDTPMPLVYPGYSLHDELEQLVACGLSNQKALQAATIHPAKVLKLESTLGSVDIGKRADLLLLDTDPIRDIHHLRDIRAVILGGKLLRREDLDKLIAMDGASRKSGSK